MNTTTHRRRTIACAIAAAIISPAFAACGSEISPPAQDISRDEADRKDTTAPMPKRTTGNRIDFDDDYGKATISPRPNRDTWRGSGNRMDFGD